MSYFTIDANNVIMECIKPPYSVKADSFIIMRLFEFHGISTQFEIRSIFRIKSVKETNLLEELSDPDFGTYNKSSEHAASNRIMIQISPYEIKTLKIDLAMDSAINK